MNNKRMKKIAAILLAAVLSFLPVKNVRAEMLDQSSNLLGLSNRDSADTLHEENLGFSSHNKADDATTDILQEEPLLSDDSPDSVSLGASDRLFAVGDPVPVSTFIEFRNAIVTAKATDILITQNFTLDVDISIPGSITIDGGGHTITDRATTGGIANLNASGVDSTVVIKNMNIVAYNYYGFVTTARAGGERATVIYDNVTYNGPQLAHMLKGNTLIIKDSDIQLAFKTGSHEVQELAEVTSIEFRGEVSITKGNTGASVYSLIWPQPYTGKKPSFTICSGANVKIDNQKSYFYYYPTATGFDFIVEDNATLWFKSATGWSYDVAHYLDRIIVGNNSSVHMIHANQKYGYTNSLTGYGGAEGGALTPKTLFEVGENSTFILENAYGTYLSQLYLNANLIQVNIKNPKLLYIQGYPSGIAAHKQSVIHLEAETINIWDKSQNHVSDYPALSNGDSGVLTGVITDGQKQTVILTDSANPMNYFQKGIYSGLLMGQYDFNFDKNPSDRDFTLNGSLGALSDNVSVSYFPRHSQIETIRSATASQGGLFSVLLDDPIPNSKGPLVADDLIEVNVMNRSSSAVNHPVLHSRLGYLVVGEDTGVTLVSVPHLNFGTRTIPDSTEIFPIIADAGIVVQDGSDGRIGWSLSVSASPLTSSNAQFISENAIGYMANGLFSSLAEPTIIWQKDSSTSSILLHEFVLEANDTSQGIVLKLDPTNAVVGGYTSTLTWSVILAP